MIREDKELLFKDLCTRLPYDVKGIITYNGDKDIFTVKGIYNDILSLSDSECCHLEDFRLYLFPLSIISNRTLEKISAFVDAKTSHVILEFFNSRHIDYRGLIEKGLAIDATGLNVY